jgi:hypothetical protein
MEALSRLVAAPAWQTACWLSLAGLFALALKGKLEDLDAFVATVRNYRILPEILVRPGALAVLAGEILVVAGLPFPATRPAAAGLAGALLFVFAGALAINIVRGRRSIDCGCFRSALRGRIGWSQVLRNGLLAAAAATLVVAPAPSTITIGDVLVGVAGACSLVVLLLAHSFLAFDSPLERSASEPLGAEGGRSA